MNVIIRLEFELVYMHFTVQHVGYYRDPAAQYYFRIYTRTTTAYRLLFIDNVTKRKVQFCSWKLALSISVIMTPVVAAVSLAKSRRFDFWSITRKEIQQSEPPIWFLIWEQCLEIRTVCVAVDLNQVKTNPPHSCCWCTWLSSFHHEMAGLLN